MQVAYINFPIIVPRIKIMVLHKITKISFLTIMYMLKQFKVTKLIIFEVIHSESILSYGTILGLQMAAPLLCLESVLISAMWAVVSCLYSLAICSVFDA